MFSFIIFFLQQSHQKMSKKGIKRSKSIFRFVRHLIPKDSVVANTEKKETTTNSDLFCDLNENKSNKFVCQNDFTETISTPISSLNLNNSQKKCLNESKINHFNKCLCENNFKNCKIDFDDTDTENEFNETLCCNNLASTSNKIKNNKGIHSSADAKSYNKTFDNFLVCEKLTTPITHRKFSGRKTLG